MLDSECLILLRNFTMSGSTLGKLFCVTSFGESHGPAIGCVVDGCPPGMPLSEADIQPELDRRKPGTKYTLLVDRRGVPRSLRKPSTGTRGSCLRPTWR